MRSSDVRARGIRLGWFGTLVLHGAATAAEIYFARWFFENHALRYYLARVQEVDVDALWGVVSRILDYIARCDDAASRGGGAGGGTTARAVPLPGVPTVLAMVVHLRGRLSVADAPLLLVAPYSGVECLKFRWELTQTYFEKVAVTKRRKLPITARKRGKSRKRKSKSKSKSAHHDDASSSSSSEESLYEEWEEEETVERTETVAQGSDIASPPFALIGTHAFRRVLHDLSLIHI